MIFQHEHHHYFHPAHAEPGGACAITLLLGKILTNQNHMSAELDTLNAKLDEAKQAAADERTEILASLAALKELIKPESLAAAIAKADELIVLVKGVHEAADDAV